jgi:hypothetical protein
MPGTPKRADTWVRPYEKYHIVLQGIPGTLPYDEKRGELL